MTRDADLWAFEGVLRKKISEDVTQFLDSHDVWDDEDLIALILKGEL